MAEEPVSHTTDAPNDTEWYGPDLSGLTVAVGVGTGRLIEMLSKRVASAGGILGVMGRQTSDFEALASLKRQSRVAFIRGHPRQIPVCDETVDLLLINGVLREVPSQRLTMVCLEFQRVLVPGGKLRVSDIIEPTEMAYNQAWTVRNEIVRDLGLTLDRPTALAVDLTRAASALRSAGFDDLTVSLLPGYLLTDSWLEETVSGVRAMASRVVDRSTREHILDGALNHLVSVYRQGGQRAAERFVLRGTKFSGQAARTAAFSLDSEVAGAG